MITTSDCEALDDTLLQDAIYRAAVDAIKQELEPRILKILNDIVAVCREDGMHVSDPFEWSDEEYAWEILISPDGYDGEETREDLDVDLTFYIIESKCRQGDYSGVSFMLDLCTVGGRILGGMSPMNYTPEWVVPWCDAKQIEGRFAYFEDADPEGVVDTIREYFPKQETAND